MEVLSACGLALGERMWKAWGVGCEYLRVKSPSDWGAFRASADYGVGTIPVEIQDVSRVIYWMIALASATEWRCSHFATWYTIAKKVAAADMDKAPRREAQLNTVKPAGVGSPIAKAGDSSRG